MKKEVINQIKDVLKQSYGKNSVSNDLFLGKGFALDDIKREKFIDIIQKESSRKGHTFVFGTTRVGKTRLAQNTIIQDIKAGKNVVIIDPKVDVELLSAAYQAALECNRENDFLLLSSIYPEFSVKLNALSHYYLEDEIINITMSGVPTEDEFFYNYAYEISSVVVRGLLYLKGKQGVKKELTFNEISLYVSFYKIKSLVEELEDYQNDPEISKIYSLGLSLLEGEKEYFGKVSSTIRGALTQLTTGNLSKIVGTAKENEFIERIQQNQGAILYVQTGAMLQEQSAYILGKITVSMIQAAVGRLYASGKQFEKELCIYIDEMSNCCYRGIENMFNKAGGSNCFITGLTQSPADIIAEIGEERARKLFDNTNTKIFMRINDEKSAKLVKVYAGKVKRKTNQLAMNGGIRSTEVEEEMLQETDFLRLKPREFFYFGFEGYFRGKTVPIEDPKVKIKLPDIINE